MAAEFMPPIVLGVDSPQFESKKLSVVSALEKTWTNSTQSIVCHDTR